MSINRAYRGRRFRTPEYNNFIHQMMILLPATIDYPDPKNIKVAVQFGYSSKLSDVDNGIKSFLDCLTKKYHIDDRYINELHLFKSIVPKGEEYIRFKIY